MVLFLQQELPACTKSITMPFYKELTVKVLPNSHC